jgi:hypothetical protein
MFLGDENDNSIKCREGVDTVVYSVYIIFRRIHEYRVTKFGDL